MKIEDAIGRMIVGVEDGDPARILLDDGSALELEPTGYEADGVYVNPLSEAEFAAVLQREMEAAIEASRIELERKEKRRAWLALTCEERREQWLWEREHNPFSYLLNQEYEGAIRDLLIDSNRMLWGSEPRKRFIYLPCNQCGERECYNAPIRVKCPTHWDVVLDEDVPPGTMFAIPASSRAVERREVCSSLAR